MDAKEIYDENGLVQINVYRKEKKWSDLQIHVEELLQTRYEHKEALYKIKINKRKNRLDFAEIDKTHLSNLLTYGHMDMPQLYRSCVI